MADHASVEPNWVQYRIWPPLIAAGNQARQTPLQSKQALGELLQQYVWFIYPFFPSSFFFKRENLEGLALLLKDVCVTFSFPLAPLQDILGHPFSNGCTLFANRHRTPPPPRSCIVCSLLGIKPLLFCKVSRSSVSNIVQLLVAARTFQARDHSSV